MNIKWKNYGLWVAVGSLVVMLTNDIAGVAPEQAEVYVDVVLGVLTAAGIVSNPEKGKGFKDKKRGQDLFNNQ